MRLRQPASVSNALIGTGHGIVVVIALARDSAFERLAARIHHQLPGIYLGAAYHPVGKCVANDVALDLGCAEVGAGTCDVRAGLVQRRNESTGCRAAKLAV